ncbi:MAG: hypothetical protein U0175_22090 [Caldilineaceae bacterium]
MKNSKPSIPPPPTQLRRAPLLRSAHWALLLGAIGGAIFGLLQVYELNGGPLWMIPGALLGSLLGIVVGGDLLIPGPIPQTAFRHERGSRVGPFRWGVLMALLMLEGLVLGSYLWGNVTLTCERVNNAEKQQVDCRRLLTGWFNSRLTNETLYDHVIGVSMSVHDELLLRHGAFEQSQAAAGFGEAAMTQVQAFLASTNSSLTLSATDWRVRLAAPACLLVAMLCAIWAFFSLRQGWRQLKDQFELGEVHWGW